MEPALSLPDKLGGAPDGKRSLRVWLRLLTCASMVERRIAARFRDDFETTLPRFDFLSALDRAGPEGLPLGEVSRMLLVTNGAVTGLASGLKADGLIETLDSADRRVRRVRLTALGRDRFAAMARAHEGWIEALFADLADSEAEQLMILLDRTKRSLQRTTPEELAG
ncbi:MarR family transcriptional regulator [Caulobacter sp. 17J65-9]|uniref:MarR family winged helix-turn-helix transcriptional regulator n=1 Tax=Caulobacter sp. 17J65-9 TaxID=2709382 RepID=UPI0013CCE2B2|nr:MarR family transcriptional regulator [Caulobacter sp. 17J65-9]NEX91445.1 MarR family transcriptional regulator [Caulobacter sp. 17J65-9]